MVKKSLWKRTGITILSAAVIFGNSCLIPLAVNADTQTGVQTEEPVRVKAEVQKADDTTELPAADNQILIVTEKEISEKKAEKIADSVDAQCVEMTDIDGEGSVAVLEIDESDTVEDAIEKAQADPAVAYAQPNYRYGTEQTDDPYSGTGTMNQWYLSRVKAEEAWEIIDSIRETRQIEPVRVAVLDTGADVDHEDLQTALNKELSARSDSMDGFLPLRIDPAGHGTHVSGIIAGTAGNQKGIAGVASGGSADKNLVDLMVVGISAPDDPESMYTYTVVNAINYAVENGAKVLNMSFGGYEKDLLLENAVANAYDRGVLSVCAAGNESTDAATGPSDYGETVSVMNLAENGSMHYTSNFGREKDVAAPGTIILSTLPGSTYGTSSGTSMATPMVTAVAAMMCAVNPNLTPEQIRNILCATAEDMGEKGFDAKTGYGAVQADKAVEAARDASASVPAESISMKESSVTLNQEETVKLQTLVLPAEALGTIRWSSSNSGVASVDAAGRVTGISEGEAVITAAVGGAETSCTVTVSGKDLPEQVEFFGKTTDKMAVGERFEFSARVLPADACEKAIAWTSSNQRVATVDEYGIVTARGEGTVVITAESYNHKKVSQEITVGPRAAGISITQSVARLQVGQSFQFEAAVTPEEALPFANLTWISSNKSKITVDAKTGLVTAVSSGQATITVYANGWRKCYIRVTAYDTSYNGKSYGLAGKSSAYNAIKLTWKQIPYADGYEIERSSKSGSGYQKIADVSGSKTSYNDTKRTTGQKYYYRIRAYYNDNGKKYCGYSSKISSKAVLTAPSVKTTAGKKKITVSWKKIQGADGYEVYRSEKKLSGYKKIGTVKSGSTVKYVNQGLRSGKKYYYKVRAYRKLASGKKVYSTVSGISPGTAK